jgi:hypothetical protein
MKSSFDPQAEAQPEASQFGQADRAVAKRFEPRRINAVRPVDENQTGQLEARHDDNSYEQ